MSVQLRESLQFTICNLKHRFNVNLTSCSLYVVHKLQLYHRQMWCCQWLLKEVAALTTHWSIESRNTSALDAFYVYWVELHKNFNSIYVQRFASLTQKMFFFSSFFCLSHFLTAPSSVIKTISFCINLRFHISNEIFFCIFSIMRLKQAKKKIQQNNGE